MNGETALRIITITAFVFILVFMIAAGGVGGSAETVPSPAAETTALTPEPAVKTTPDPEPLPEPTVILTPTPEPASADPVEGTWILQGSSTGHLLLTAGGTGEMTTITDEVVSARAVAWTYDPAVRVGHLRAYRLAVPAEGDCVLYLDEGAGTLTLNGQGIVLTYAPAP
ncbi:hypothetical protein [Methanofollis tationis]|uniref:Uncharacterized protein n=1 Tax=Methanofollis tationis TaxID=81417 RepID=A0A7K4HMN2_9EURY|nr:hypothetical protein [Methanofollis tationis]NVO66535.1 hypothetical protein [Methanofollis tationis]